MGENSCLAKESAPIRTFCERISENCSPYDDENTFVHARGTEENFERKQIDEIENFYPSSRGFPTNISMKANKYI